LAKPGLNTFRSDSIWYHTLDCFSTPVLLSFCKYPVRHNTSAHVERDSSAEMSSMNRRFRRITASGLCGVLLLVTLTAEFAHHEILSHQATYQLAGTEDGIPPANARVRHNSMCVACLHATTHLALLDASPSLSPDPSSSICAIGYRVLSVETLSVPFNHRAPPSFPV